MGQGESARISLVSGVSRGRSFVVSLLTKLLDAKRLDLMPSLQFREDKATQEAAKLLQLGGGRMNLMKLVKLMYLADRTALVSWGRLITMDSLCSLKHGPIASNVLNLINEQPNPREPRYWHRFISERYVNYDVELIADPEKDQLSPAEEELIDRVFAEHGNKDQWQLSEFTHTLPEWRDPGDSMKPIQLRDILFPAGYKEEEVQEIEAELEHISQIGRTLR
jgi:uncharacterized phage-associated protein